ncbi:MAG TPA: carbohydrate ABC transporter permease [Chloroflexota bacterium]|nr:carbohydrate ABC transporter permease [Chloroflexota bacterium]
MKRHWSLTLAMYLVLAISSVVILYPLLFMLSATFTSPAQYYRTAFFPIPDLFDLRNYIPILIDCTEGCIYQSMLITAVREVWYLCWMLVVSIFGGYAFARLNFPGKNALFLFFLSGLMVPSILTMLPTYIMLARWPLAGGNDLLGQGGHGFVNAWPALFMLGMLDVVALFLIKQNYEMIPGDYEEAALVDGAGTLRIILQIYVPMLRPALTALAVLVFIGIWNDYLGPLIFVGGNKDITPVALTVQRLIYGLTQRESQTLADFPLIFGATTLMSIPPVVVYFALQRYIVQGLVGVGIKG